MLRVALLSLMLSPASFAMSPGEEAVPRTEHAEEVPYVETARLAYLDAGRIHVRSNWLTVGSLSATVLGAELLLQSIYNGPSAFGAVSPVLLVAGATGMTAGVVFANVGANRATRAVSQVSGLKPKPGFGYLGIGLLLTGAVFAPYTRGISVLVGVPASLVCGWAQFRRARVPVRDRGWVVLPTTNGAQLVAQF